MKTNNPKINNPESTQNQDRRYRKNDRSGSIIGAFILISLGVIFLLSNFGILPWNFWDIIWRLWPIFLITGGLSILFRRKND